MTLDLETPHPLTKGTLHVVDIWARLGQVERKYALDKFCQTGGTHRWMEG